MFMEWYRFDELEAEVGHALDLRQANTSVSRAGVVRGIHFADLDHAQAKYVTATAGAVIDFIVDIRVGSPTFGTWDSVLLDTDSRRAVYIAEGLGHAFVALTEGATVSYLVTNTYTPGAEHGVSPLDPHIGLDFSAAGVDPILSEKDRDAPLLHESAASGSLPTWDASRRLYDELSTKDR